jgi:hypothetical protein
VISVLMSKDAALSLSLSLSLSLCDVRTQGQVAIYKPGRESVMCQCKVFLASVEGPCLHRPENWLVRQPIDL